jgi:plastocyanin
MRGLAISAAVAAFAFSAALPLPASSVRLPAPRLPNPASLLASGAIRGRVDVRVAAGTSSTDVRPDPAAVGMGAMRDAQDKRRSVVYLESAPRAAFDPAEERHARMNQLNERFVPRVLAITAGAWVDFPNSDRTYHNVFSLSKPRSFNLGRYAAGQSKAVRFDRTGVVRVFCEIHSHMSAFILVFAHRYHAVTDDDGRYRLENVPPGTYTVAVWHESIRGEPPRRTATIAESGGDVDADFTIR